MTRSGAALVGLGLLALAGWFGTWRPAPVARAARPSAQRPVTRRPVVLAAPEAARGPATPWARFQADVRAFRWPAAWGLLPPAARRAVPLPLFVNLLALPAGPAAVLGHVAREPDGALAGWTPGFPAEASALAAPPPPVPAALWPIYQAAQAATGVPWALLAAQDWVESGFDPTAVRHDANGTVDRGIAQINSGAHPTVTPAEAFDPAWAIAWQADTLARLARTSGGWANALAIYHAGVPLAAAPPGTAAYVTAILALAAAWGGPGG